MPARARLLRWARRGVLTALAVLLAGSIQSGGAQAQQAYSDSPWFADKIASGDLPPVNQRLPEDPAVANMSEAGRYGGDLTMLMGSAKDTRMMVVYSYARLVGYDRDFKIVADIAESYDVEDGRIFTFHLRKGMKWSDGKPFDAEDFRYWWEDVANNQELSPTGPPSVLSVDGEWPKVEFPDKYTVRYSWSKPNADFLPALAGTTPLYIYRPSHYLKKFHVKYADAADLAQKVQEAQQPSWAALHNRRDNMYKNDNPKQPTLDPWMLVTKPPAERFVFERNPYYYRVDPRGRQLPYVDRVIFDIVDSKLIPAKVGAGETTLQSRNLRFDNYTFLKDGETRGNYRVRLWTNGMGSQVALYPNLNCNDPVWRDVLRDVRFRRALSLGIDRHEINQVIYYGLAKESANMVLPQSPLYNETYANAWASLDITQANALLDEMGLDKRDEDGVRLLPDGRTVDILVESAGESTEESDVLELIRDSWAQLGIRLYVKPSQREVFRNRIFAGDNVMAVWTGLDNGIPTPDVAPLEFAPTSQQQLQWPKWGQFRETMSGSGEAADMPVAKQLLDLLQKWRESATDEERTAIWEQMLQIYSDQVFVIGTVNSVPQPVVAKNFLHNLPDTAVYNWEPGAQLGVYKPDTFWLDEKATQTAAAN
ncbi:MAG TPA: ABC transporter substrate-binding protein [Hypericibacter adhaerens]|uniref:ABC transporter substrate-binding protein n=1 Tax=Hypericibacter adhaerens TaxID=2602016 RepID=UPI002C99206D|nr:ABC transporter substrate-binding protein [Hypericibacter adhaerens]HWA42043.1 ABC transporter substrate-binding protein [Hypericibacter adhaerens]